MLKTGGRGGRFVVSQHDCLGALWFVACRCGGRTQPPRRPQWSWRKKPSAKPNNANNQVNDARPELPFCKIIAGKIPSKKVYEDEHVFAFHDIAPWAPVHFLLVPKLHIPSMAQITPEHSALMGRI
jgi:hypothetical protein